MKVKSLFTVILCLLAVCASAQNLDWYSLWGSSSEGSHIRPNKMVVDSEDNLYVTADFCGNAVTVEDQTLVSQQGADLGDAVLVKITPTKTVAWTRIFSVNKTAKITDIVVDKQDNIVAVGTFTGTINPDGQHSLAFDDGEYDDCTVNAFVVRFDKNGNTLNLWNIPAYELSSVRVATDGSGNVYVAGTYGSYIVLTGTTGVGTFGTDNQLFLAKYSPSGTCLQSKYTESSTVSYSNAALAVDDNGEVYVTGTFIGSFSFAGGDFATADNDAFLQKYDNTLTELWAKRIGGNSSIEKGIDVVLSPVGDVAVGGLVETSTALTISDVDSTFAQHYGSDSPIPHIAVTTFTKNGDFRWHYWYGYSTGTASFYSLRCTSEGVYYLALAASGRIGDMSTGYNGIAGQNSGVWLVDGQHISHNTNGGSDAILCVLTPEGKLANLLRPGGAQTECFRDVALTADKKHAAFLLELNVREADATIPVNNFWTSYTDIKAASTMSDFTTIKVPCPENGTTYTSAYKGIFYSSCLLYTTLPEVVPNELPDYTAGTAYSQTLAMQNTVGAGTLVPLDIPSELTFANNLLAGTPTGTDNKYVSIIASDVVPRYSYFTLYAADTQWDSETGGTTTRGNSRNVRNFVLKSTETNGISDVNAKSKVFYPTLVSDVLHVDSDAADFTINIYSLLGKRVLTVANQKSVDISRLPSGIYLAEMTIAGGKTATQRIIVK